MTWCCIEKVCIHKGEQAINRRLDVGMPRTGNANEAQRHQLTLR
jgi:hypothetical protein